MSAATTSALISLMLGALDKAAKAGTLLRTVQAEGRHPTPAEIEVFLQDDDVARDNLQAAIDAAKGA